MKVSDTKLLFVFVLVVLTFSYLFFISGGEKIAGDLLLFGVSVIGGAGVATWYDIIQRRPYKSRNSVGAGYSNPIELSILPEAMNHMRVCRFCKQNSGFKVIGHPKTCISDLQNLENMKDLPGEYHVICKICGARGPTEYSLVDVIEGWDATQAVSYARANLNKG